MFEFAAAPVFCFGESRSQLNRIWTILSLETWLRVCHCQSCFVFVCFGQTFLFHSTCPPLMFWAPHLLHQAPPELTCNNFSPQVKTLLDLLCLGSSQTEVFCIAFMLKQEVTLFLAVLFEIYSKSWHCSCSHLNVMVNWSCRSGLSHTATTLGSVWLMRQLSYSSLLTL